MKLSCKQHQDFYFYASDEEVVKNGTYKSFFFNSSKFFIVASADSKKYFYIIDSIKDEIVGSFNLSIINGIGYSPYKAPFGSLEFKKNLSPEIIFEFWQFLNQWSEKNNLKSIFIKSNPQDYHPEKSAIVVNSLIRAGYSIQNGELNQHIMVTKNPLSTLLSRMDLRRIHKSLEDNLYFSKSGIDQLEPAYKLIKLSRDRKNFPTTMSYQELENMFKMFPDNYFLFLVKDGENIAALAISILVNNKILYNFYHAHDERYNKFAPMNLLLQGIYTFCQQQKIKVLDLGTSTSDNILNEGLYFFKKKFGAKTSIKFSFMKEI
ncbi:MAG: GNAT family N-acetyltransferase [Bacteroidota bacterium]|nr:GNAT family N-acetyltransferase [Bacteroidota bacterium]